MRKIKKFLLLGAVAFIFLFSVSLYLPFPREKLNPGHKVSFSILDRQGILLREVLSDEGGRCRWLGLDEISPELIWATVEAEDKHFFLHPGVDFLAVIRAFRRNLIHGRVVSGASTISQQVVRNIFRHKRNLLVKIREIWLALRLEKTLTKEEILVQYLNRISYGNQAYGIEAASRLYFDKPARDLSLAEAVFLAGLPRSPTGLNPYRSFPAAKKRQEKILDLMLTRGRITGEQRERAVNQELALIPDSIKFKAPHFCDFILSRIPPEKKRKLVAVRTTLNVFIQEKVEKLVRFHLDLIKEKNITNAAVLVMDNAAGGILAMVGSRDFFDGRNSGQINGALSLRQPGSTLKPFTYALAIENGMTAASVIQDRSLQYRTPEGFYRPRNYDQRFRGPVRLREALACSYNIPAVSVLHQLGQDRLYYRLKSLGFESLEKGPGYYGIGLTLGNGEVTLLELVRSYSALARGGLFIKEKYIEEILGPRELLADEFDEIEEKKSRRVFSPEVSYIITHILSDSDARVPAFGYLSPMNLPFACAAKTGTTREFKDNWLVGYSPRFTVGVWVGNFDGSPMHNVSGIAGCGLLFKDIMLLLEAKTSQEEFERPQDLSQAKVCPVSGMKASSSCPGFLEELFLPGTESREECFVHEKEDSGVNLADFINHRTGLNFEIRSPVEGDVFRMDNVLLGEYQRLKLEVSLPPWLETEEVEWIVDGRKISRVKYPFFSFWKLEPGRHTVEAAAVTPDKTIYSQTVSFQVLK
ncbi:MAG: penicillin-binding protein 1C [Acidobacteriota bacterium]